MATNGKQNSGRIMRVLDVVQEPLETLAPIGGYENMPIVSIEAAVVPLTALIPNINDHVKETKSKYNQQRPSEGLTIDELVAIGLYTAEASTSNTSLYQQLNGVLRSKNRKELPSWFLYLKLLLTALSRLQSSRQFLFRGVKADLHQDYSQDKIVTWWGFSSCTMKVDVLNTFLGNTGPRTMFTIDCSSGKNISCFSYFPEESEVLLLPETQFKVISSLNQPDGLWVVQLEEIRSPLSIPGPIDKPKLDPNCNGRSCQSCGKCADWRLKGDTYIRLNDATCKHRFNPSNHENFICQCK